MNTHKICLLLKPETKLHQQRDYGGTEQMLFHDYLSLKDKGNDVQAYSRGDHHLTIKIAVFEYLIILFSKLKLSSSIDVFRKLFTDLIHIVYLISVIPKLISNSTWVTYSFPAICIVKKSVNVYQNRDVNFPLIGIFSTKYRKSMHLFCSVDLKNYYHDKYPSIFNDTNSRVLYNSVPDNFNDVTVPEGIQRKFIGKHTLLFASSWYPEKGLLLLLKSLDTLSVETLKDIRLVVASSKEMWFSDKVLVSSHLDEIEALISKLRAKGLLILTLGGVRHSQMKYLYWISDLTVFPSVWEEPFGLVALESSYVGTPVIAFDVGAVTEVVSTSENHVLENISMDGLARIILNILQSDKLHIDSKLKKPSIKDSTMLLSNRTDTLVQIISSL